MQTKSEFIELRSVAGTISRRWWLVLLFAVLAGVVGYIVSINQTPVYKATTSLLVGSSIQSAAVNRNDLQASEQLAATYADLTRRQPVLQRAIDELGVDMSWGKLRSRVQTEVPGGTHLLEIQVEADSPEEAEILADEIARQLILLSPSGGLNTTEQREDESFVQERLDELKVKIESGQANLEEMENRFLSTSDDEIMVELVSRIDTLQTMIGRWEGNYANLQQSIEAVDATNNLAVLEPAQASSKPVRPLVRLNTTIAVLLGFSLALGLIFLMEFLDDTLKSPNDLSRILGLPTLGAIAQIKSKDPRDALMVNHDPFSAAYEDYRLLRTKIQFMAVEHPGRSVVVTSPARSEGKSLTAANLGIVMAQAGQKTIIVDANLRQPTMNELFQLSNREGLTHLLHGEDKEIDRFLCPTLVPNLRVLPSGAVPSNPSELLGSARMSVLLAELSSMADVIICDSTEAVTVADVSVLSNKVDGVLLVIESGQTDRNTALQAVENLRDANANILGGVLNRVASGGRGTRQSNTENVNSPSKPHKGDDSLTYVESTGG